MSDFEATSITSSTLLLNFPGSCSSPPTDIQMILSREFNLSITFSAASLSSPVPSVPAVSCIISRFPDISISFPAPSRVVPGISETRASPVTVNRLNNVDFPAFLGPIIQTELFPSIERASIRRLSDSSASSSTVSFGFRVPDDG